jgi:CBS domain containing-hemolysin-like protein
MDLAVILVCLLLYSFFSGMEIAFLSSNKIYLELEKKQENFSARTITKITQNPSKFIATLFIGNYLSLIVYSYFAGQMITNWVLSIEPQLTEGSVVLIQVLLSGMVILLTTVFLSKIFFKIYANKLIKFFALPTYFFYQLFHVFSSGFLWISDRLLRKMNATSGDDASLIFSKTELGHYIHEQMATTANDEIDSEIQIFQNALEFSSVKARDIMTPRTELVAIDLYDTVPDLRNLFIKTGYSKILIYQNTLDDIIGYVHSFELFKKPKTIKSVMTPVEYVPDTILVKDTLDILTKKRKSIAVVLDEYGGTSGIVTVEDIVEELFGEIEDEHDEEESLTENQVAFDQFIFSARLDVAYINEKYDLGIPESDSYGTLGGYIVNTTNAIPQTAEIISMDTFQFEILEVTNTKIDVVKMIVLDQK